MKECWVNVYGPSYSPAHLNGGYQRTKALAVERSQVLAEFMGLRTLYRLHIRLKYPEAGRAAR